MHAAPVAIYRLDNAHASLTLFAVLSHFTQGPDVHVSCICHHLAGITPPSFLSPSVPLFSSAVLRDHSYQWIAHALESLIRFEQHEERVPEGFCYVLWCNTLPSRSSFCVPQVFYAAVGKRWLSSLPLPPPSPFDV